MDAHCTFRKDEASFIRVTLASKAPVQTVAVTWGIYFEVYDTTLFTYSRSDWEPEPEHYRRPISLFGGLLPGHERDTLVFLGSSMDFPRVRNLHLCLASTFAASTPDLRHQFCGPDGNWHQRE